MPTSLGRPAARSDSRRQHVLDSAARLFAGNGFADTSMRDIARVVGMLPGSIYYHFPSKEDLLFAVYEEGVNRISGRVAAAVAGASDPWRRLEAACRAHLESILDHSDYARVVVRVRPHDVPAVAPRLVALRDAYEQGFKELVDDLGVPDAKRSKYLRLMLMGAMNGAQVWYRPGGDSPPAIARHFISLLRGAAGA